MNTDQLFHGELADGKIMPDYSTTSVLQYGKPAGPWKLFETGDFYSGFFMKGGKFPIVFDSRDQKTGAIRTLLEIHGLDSDQIFGLNKSNLKDLARNYVLPEIQDIVRKAIQVR